MCVTALLGLPEALRYVVCVYVYAYVCVCVCVWCVYVNMCMYMCTIVCIAKPSSKELTKKESGHEGFIHGIVIKMVHRNVLLQ